MSAAPFIAVLRDRRVWLMVLTALLAVLLGFVSIPDRQAIAFVSRAGFWMVLAAFVVWVWALARTFGPEIRSLRGGRVDGGSGRGGGAGGVVLLVHESFGFKIVMDELMLLGTSMGMHFDKAALTPLRGNDIQGAFMILDGIVDKRPLYFPFLVSLLHDISGYRPANAFVLNGALTFVFLGLMCAAGRALAGRWAGWLAVALLAGLPLLGQNATGGGFEMLNLVMIAATVLLGARYLEKRDAAALTAFCYAAILLAQVRYESVVFLLPVAVLVGWVWWRQGAVLLPWPILAAPLLMVHYPLQHRIFDVRTSAWEMASKPGYSEVFSFRYIPDNLAHAMSFFFGKAADQPNSLVLSALGCVAVPFFVLRAVKRLRSLGREPAASAAVIIFSLGFAVQFGIMMCYFWGQFDDVVIRRLSLPTHLAMVYAVLAVLPEFPRPGVRRALVALAVIGLITRSVPSMAAHAYSQEYTPGRETAWRREFMARQPRPDYLMIDNDSTLWVTHLVSATPTVVAVNRRTDIAFHLRNRTFSAVYVFQRFTIDPENGRMTLRDGDDLGPAFVLEPVVEQRLHVLTLSRISRVVEIREGAEILSTPDPGIRPVTKSRAEIDRARQQFIEQYMKQLP
jgi:hypothetical protein